MGDPRRRRARWRERLAPLLLTLVGCASTCGDSSQPGAIGELGNGNFLYECGGTSDPVCEFSEFGEMFPECIALGGQFDLEYRLLDGGALGDGIEIDPVLYIESVNQRFFEGVDEFSAQRIGEAAFIVRESEHVLDLIHMQIVEIDDFDIADRDPATPTDTIDISLGETQTYRVFPRSVSCAQVGGSVPVDADSSDEAVATISGGDVLRIQAQALGVAVVRVRLGEIEKAITVNVVDGPVGPATTTGDSSGSASGTGSTGDDGSGTATGATDGGSSTGGSSTGGM